MARRQKGKEEQAVWWTEEDFTAPEREGLPLEMGAGGEEKVGAPAPMESADALGIPVLVSRDIVYDTYTKQSIWFLFGCKFVCFSLPICKTEEFTHSSHYNQDNDCNMKG